MSANTTQVTATAQTAASSPATADITPAARAKIALASDATTFLVMANEPTWSGAGVWLVRTCMTITCIVIISVSKPVKAATATSFLVALSSCQNDSSGW